MNSKIRYIIFFSSKNDVYIILKLYSQAQTYIRFTPHIYLHKNINIPSSKYSCSAKLQNRHKQLESVLDVRNAVRTLRRNWCKRQTRRFSCWACCQHRSRPTLTSRKVLVIRSFTFVSVASMALSWRPKRDAMPPKCQHTVLTNLPRQSTDYEWRLMSGISDKRTDEIDGCLLDECVRLVGRAVPIFDQQQLGQLVHLVHGQRRRFGQTAQSPVVHLLRWRRRLLLLLLGQPIGV